MSAFSVVKTIENNKIFLTTVPDGWVINNTLYFPRGDNWKSLRVSCDTPEINWKKYKCTVKRSGINNLADALDFEKQLVEFKGTDEEESYFANSSQKRMNPERTRLLKNVIDYNSRLDDLQNENNTIIQDEVSSKILQNNVSEISDGNLNLSTDNTTNSLPIVLQDENVILNCITESELKTEMNTCKMKIVFISFYSCLQQDKQLAQK